MAFETKPNVFIESVSLALIIDVIMWRINNELTMIDDRYKRISVM